MVLKWHWGPPLVALKGGEQGFSDIVRCYSHVDLVVPSMSLNLESFAVIKSKL